MDKVDLLVKLRDSHLQAADALNEYLETLGSGATRRDDEQHASYDPEKIIWTDTTGTNGPYQKAIAEGTSQPRDFEALVQDLKSHKGKFQRNGLFYWLFDKTPMAIGRKPLRK
jgi:hypothetical protein